MSSFTGFFSRQICLPKISEFTKKRFFPGLPTYRQFLAASPTTGQANAACLCPSMALLWHTLALPDCVLAWPDCNLALAECGLVWPVSGLAWPESDLGWSDSDLDLPDSDLDLPECGLDWPDSVVAQEEASPRNTGSWWAQETTTGCQEHKGGLVGARARWILSY